MLWNGHKDVRYSPNSYKNVGCRASPQSWRRSRDFHVEGPISDESGTSVACWPFS
jgi:hypothetical protein